MKDTNSNEKTNSIFGHAVEEIIRVHSDSVFATDDNCTMFQGETALSATRMGSYILRSE